MSPEAAGGQAPRRQGAVPGAGAGGRGPSLRASAAAALGQRNLVLVGFMGTGKSTLGRTVARMLRRPFVDTDARVEGRAGRTIPALFAERGEAGFRDLEAAVVAEVAGAEGQVIATGGGVLGRPESVVALRASGVLVALVARPDVILHRVGGPTAALRRPLLAGGDPLGRIGELLAARADLYAQADLQLDTSDMGRDAACQALLRLCAERAERVRRR